MAERGKEVVYLKRHKTPTSEGLRTARKAARLHQTDMATALKVHSRTVARWEFGQTRPSKAEWTSIVSYLAGFVPDHAQRLAALAGVPSPVATPPPVDQRAIEAALYRAADQLDVSPRRVREALRELLGTVIAAHANLDDLVRALEDKSAAQPPGAGYSPPPS